MTLTRQQWDAAHPTIVRYVGLLLSTANTCVIFVLALGNKPGPIVTLMGLYVPLGALIAYKWLRDAVEPPQPPTRRTSDSAAKQS